MEFTESLKKNFQFRYVYNRGKSFANYHLVMYVIKNGKNINRLGISVSKKVGNSVTRSRVTRLIRESYRLSENKVQKGYDIVVIARNTLKGKGYFETESAVLHLSRIHGILKDNNKDSN